MHSLPFVCDLFSQLSVKFVSCSGCFAMQYFLNHSFLLLLHTYAFSCSSFNRMNLLNFCFACKVLCFVIFLLLAYGQACLLQFISFYHPASFLPLSHHPLDSSSMSFWFCSIFYFNVHPHRMHPNNGNVTESKAIKTKKTKKFRFLRKKSEKNTIQTNKKNT